MKTISAYTEDGENAIKVAHRVAMATAFNTGRTITVNDDNPAKVAISDYSGILAVVIQK
jgi:hypothetical protein